LHRKLWIINPAIIRLMSTEERKNIVKIMVFGTFDGLHLGHLNFFKQAKSLTQGKSTLIVSIARDKNVKRIKKNLPTMGEKRRMTLVKKSKLVDKVVLGGMTNHVPHIVRENPNIIALGYDQKDYVQNLKKDLKNKGLKVKIVRMKAYKKHIFKNHLLKKKMKL
jgi:FAD synthetase